MALIGSQMEPANPAPQPSTPDFYEQTRFWAMAKSYGVRDLIVTWGSGLGLVAACGVLFLYLDRDLHTDGLEALAIAYVSLAAALFAIVLAGLAVVATFFDRDYVAQLRDAGTLNQALFGFWWVASVAVVSLLVSVGLTVVTYAHSARGITAVAAALATLLFVAALLESLTLVGTIMRHGLYRAEMAAQSIRITRRTDQPSQ